MHPQDTVPQEPGTLAPNAKQQYAQLCALVGERQYLILKLEAEIYDLTQKMDELKKGEAPSESP